MAKTWLITGCSTGFGRVMAELLLQRGEQVVATARRPETLESLVEAHGDRALALQLDVTSPDDIEAAVAAARARFGTIDVLVNNAGYADIGVIEETPLDVLRSMMETNLFGALGLIRAVLPEMRRQRAGQIVNVGSVAGQIGFPSLAYYCASKAALRATTETLAAEVRPLGIKVTLAELGPFATNFVHAMTMNLPSTPDYDLAALSQGAGNSHWGAGDDPRDGAAALLAALDDPAPPLYLVLGQDGLDVVARYDAIRMAERERWMKLSQLELPGAA